MSRRRKDCMKTLKELRECEKEILVPEDLVGILRCDSQSISLAAKTYPEKLGFPVIVMGSRVRIPKEGFIRFCEGSGTGA